MTRSLRCLLIAGLCLSGAAGVSSAMPEWSEELGVDFWNIARLNRQMDQYGRQGEELDSRAAVLNRRIELKVQIADDAIAGRLTLTEAARSYRNLNAAVPYFASIARQKSTDMTEDEVHCRNVMAYVQNKINDRPEARDCLKRLEAELRQLRAENDGRVRLPN